MKRFKQNKALQMFSVEEFEGETIEVKCAKIIQTNEPISEGVPLIFTEKKDGVRPETNIRTDRWEIANDAMGAVNKTKIAVSQGTYTPPEETKKGD